MSIAYEMGSGAAAGGGGGNQYILITFLPQLVLLVVLSTVFYQLGKWRGRKKLLALSGYLPELLFIGIIVAFVLVDIIYYQRAGRFANMFCSIVNIYFYNNILL
jgi:hypothetical protein